MVAVELASSFGWVVLTLIAINLEVFSFGVRVGGKRREKKIPYPKVEGDEEFERYYRVHYNALEGLALIITLVVLSGLWNPLVGVVSGVTWIVGREIYARGYYIAVEKRMVGAMIFHLGELIGLIGSVMFAVKLLSA
ncbi:hypothetical protein ABK040_010375 [Willaertia magna]